MMKISGTPWTWYADFTPVVSLAHTHGALYDDAKRFRVSSVSLEWRSTEIMVIDDP